MIMQFNMQGYATLLSVIWQMKEWLCLIAQSCSEPLPLGSALQKLKEKI
jgi:hypothetical protein